MAPSKNTAREAREARDRLRRYNARQAVHTHQARRRTHDNVIALVVLVVIAALATVSQVYYFSSGPGAPKAKPTASASPTPSASAAGSNVGAVPPTSLGGGKIWTGTLTLNSTKLGISLNGKLAPQAVSSVVNDIQTKFLDGKACWRLTDSAQFDVLQCGGSSGSDTGGTAYSFGPLENTPTDTTYPTGSIVMARVSNNAYGEGHQFFITYGTTTLPNDSAGGYSIIGKVTSGLSELKKNITSKGISGGSTDGAPKVKTTITSVTIK